MKIKFSTNGLLKDSLGTEEFTMVLADSATLQDVVNVVASKLEEHQRKIIIDSDGIMQKGMMVVLNDEMFQGDITQPLEGGDSVSILMPMAGG